MKKYLITQFICFRDDADKILRGSQEGAFLIRESVKRPGEYAVALS